MDVISPVPVLSPGHHGVPVFPPRRSPHAFSNQADRTFTTRSGGSPRFPHKPSLRRVLLGFGGTICVGTCLLWYYKNNLQRLHAATAPQTLPEVEPKSRGTCHLKEVNSKLQLAVSEARELLQRVKDEHGCPGIVAAVSVNGEHIWSDAIGYSDVENQLPMTTRHVLRIASVSKVLTVTALAKLWEEGKVDIDRPIQEYVLTFPEKVWENKKVTITTRQVLSHLSGIRHYRKSGDEEKDSTASSTSDTKDSSNSKSKSANDKYNTERKESEGLGDAKYPEFFSQTKYDDVTAALDQFKDDPLVHEPGTKFLYSSHAWTLVSAVIESAAGKPYLKVMQDTFSDLGLAYTIPDRHEPIIARRARTYLRNKKNKKLENAPFVDLSNKWAGGGFLSTVGDLVKFGDAMLYSYQYSPRCVGQLPGYLKPETIQKLWIPVEEAAKEGFEGRYGLGWHIIDKPQKYGQGCPSKHFILHTGGAVGASSILLVEPRMEQGLPDYGGSCRLPRGVSVAIITNIDGVSLTKTAKNIARLFRDVE